MQKTIAIKPINIDPMMVTWDLGRRCNYDCSYCEARHHNNYSKHRSLEECKDVYQFIKDWTGTYNEHRNNKFSTTINFTGGEPTNNPDFWNIIKYIREDDKDIKLSLTTNGTWHKKHTDFIVENMNGVTISYHCEADDKIKSMVLDNICRLKETNLWLQVNLMLHVDYFEECKQVYEELKQLNVNVKLRPIGDGNVAIMGWFKDTDGNMRRTTHEYTEEQQEWFYKQHGKDYKTEKEAKGTDLGRQCCGSRQLCGKVDNSWQPITLVDTHFKDWYCMVDWYFLHIDHETELVYHHQTCQAYHGKRKGSIGSLQEKDKLLSDLKHRLTNDDTPIICPNERCGCGMCVPKSKDLTEYKEIFNAIRG